MDFELTEEQRAFRDAVRAFAERHLRDGALARAHDDEYPWEVAQLMAEQGLLGITMPEEDGGQGGTLMDAVIAIETIASVCPRSADVVQAGNFGAIRVLAEYGTPSRRSVYLDRCSTAKRLIAVGMTEPEAGCAVTELHTTATPDGDGYRINGSKIFTTHGRARRPVARLRALRSRRRRHRLGADPERDAPGFTQGAPSRSCPARSGCRLYFDNVYVPPENVLLTDGGFKKQIAGFNVERIGNTARSLALGRYAYDVAREHALHAQAVRPAAVRIPGPAVEVRRHEDEARCRRSCCSTARRSTPTPALPSAEETAIAKAFCNQTGFDVASKRCRSWAAWATARNRWSNTASAHAAAG